MLTFAAFPNRPLSLNRAGHHDGSHGAPDVQRVAAEVKGCVIKIDPADEIFGRADRAVVRLERDRQPVDELLLLRRGRRVVALVNRCPHLGRALDDARARGGALVCAGHGRRYSLRAGRVLGAPSALRLLPVRRDGQALLIDISGLTS
jgi:nitrite reductase/ring-hydroxylating ferredoxin subunit